MSASSGTAYPTPKPWTDRVTTIPSLPGGIDAQANVLRAVLERLPADRSSVLSVGANGTAVEVRVDDLMTRQLSRSGLVQRDPEDNWTTSPYGQVWLESGDPAFLLAVFHAHVKFVGELLKAIKDGLTHNDLLAVANAEYDLSWSSVDPVRRRTTWLRNLGFLEQWGTRLILTPAGEKILGELVLHDPAVARVAAEAEARRDSGGKVPTPAAIVQAQLDLLDQEALRKRRPLIGYIPRGAKASRGDSSFGSEPIEALRVIVGLLGREASIDEFLSRCQASLGVKKSSFTSMLHAFRHLRMVEQVGLNKFAATNFAGHCLAPGAEVDLVRLLHSQFLFVGEILRHLDEPSGPGALVQIAKDLYGYQAVAGEIRTRLGFLHEAGLVERVDWQRYRVSVTGKALRVELPLQGPGRTGLAAATASESPVPGSEAGGSGQELATLYEELRRFSKSQDSSTSFEQAVARAFENFGLHAEHLGGAGKTDVLVIAELAPSDRYRAIIDAKTSAAGIVSENNVNFEVLRDHKKKHRADYVVLVGPDFSPRIKKWAVDNKCALYTVEDLIQLLSRHVVSPLNILEMRAIFERLGPDLSEVEERYDRCGTRSDVLSRVLALVFSEANDDDPDTNGYISLENLHYVLRKDLDPRPTVADIEQALKFLQHDLIAAVAKDGQRYRVVDSPVNVARRLESLAKAILRDSSPSE